MNQTDQLNCIDEEQLAMIITALDEIAANRAKLGMEMLALRYRITADKVRGIKQARETAFIQRMRKREKEKAALREQDGTQQITR
jgi:hypothetical protein